MKSVTFMASSSMHVHSQLLTSIQQPIANFTENPGPVFVHSEKYHSKLTNDIHSESYPLLVCHLHTFFQHLWS